MGDYIVSARKYRPDTFDTVVGQKSTTSTLKNAIRTAHLAQAYLFCGPRGVGKTTCARIFAKTINCLSITQQMEPCNTCESCKSFNENRSYTIHELDAASNNSVEDIRNIIDQVRIPPQMGKYSVYIIDEVHMLSQSAFNSFLKTLEEPPKHAIFILATTEKHKILPTILSRCQIFDFNRIRINDTVEFLGQISDKEGVKYDTEALNIIAQKADGAMRDALSIYDQIVSFSENNITYKGVIENLNILDYEYYFQLTDFFLAADVTGTLVIYDEILAKGFDAQNFLNGLSKHFRDLLVCKAEKSMQLLEVGESIKEKYKLQSQRCSDEFLFRALEVSNECDLSYKSSKSPRLHVEIALIRLCNLNEEKKKEQLLSDVLVLHGIEQKVQPVAAPAKAKQQSNLNPSIINQIVQTPSAPEVKISLSPKSTHSIKDALKSISKEPEPVIEITEVEFEDVQDTENIDLVEESPTEITFLQLEAVWSNYMEKLKKEEPRMHQALKGQVLAFSDNHLLPLSFRSNAQIDDFKLKIKPALLLYLRVELKNNSIEIEEVIIEGQAAVKSKYLSEADKLKQMVEKNPALQKLRQEFNLDFD